CRHAATKPSSSRVISAALSNRSDIRSGSSSLVEEHGGLFVVVDAAGRRVAQLLPDDLHLLGDGGFGRVGLVDEGAGAGRQLGWDRPQVVGCVEVSERLELRVALGTGGAVEPRVERRLADRTAPFDPPLELVEERFPARCRTRRHAGLAIVAWALNRASASRHASRSGSITARQLSTRSRSFSTFALISSFTTHTYSPLRELAWAHRSVSSAPTSAIRMSCAWVSASWARTVSRASIASAPSTRSRESRSNSMTTRWTGVAVATPSSR